MNARFSTSLSGQSLPSSAPHVPLLPRYRRPPFFHKNPVPSHVSFIIPYPLPEHGLATDRIDVSDDTVLWSEDAEEATEEGSSGDGGT